MFSYVKISECLRNGLRYNLLKNFKQDIYVWLAFLYVCFTSGSLTVFFSLSVFLTYFLRKRVLIFIPLFLFLVVIGFVLSDPESQLVNRFLILTQSLKGGAGNIINKDISASVRIIPYIEFFKSFDLLTISTWLGHGVDQFELNSTRLILGPESMEHRNIGAKSILALFYDHGIITGILFCIFLFKNTSPKFFSFETLFYILIYSVITLNHYVLWLYIMLMFTNRHFASKINNISKSSTRISKVYENRY